MRTVKGLLIIAFLLLLMVLVGACNRHLQNENVDNGDSTPAITHPADKPYYDHSPNIVETDPEINPETNPTTSEKPQEPPEPVRPTGKTMLRISAVGDIMMHLPQVESAAQNDDSFNFKPVFEYIKSYIESADLALGNIETTISTPEKGFYGFPRFRSPKEVIEALKYTGFDIITTSNNHILDGFEFGLEHTLNTPVSYTHLTLPTNREV